MRSGACRSRLVAEHLGAIGPRAQASDRGHQFGDRNFASCPSTMRAARSVKPMTQSADQWIFGRVSWFRIPLSSAMCGQAPVRWSLSRLFISSLLVEFDRELRPAPQQPQFHLRPPGIFALSRWTQGIKG